MATSRDAWFKKKTTPLELLFGAHYALTSDFHIGVGVGPGLTRGYGTPQVRGLLSIAWIPAVEPTPPSDRDGDGVLDTDDACPEVAGVRTDDPQDQRLPASPARSRQGRHPRRRRRLPRRARRQDRRPQDQRLPAASARSRQGRHARRRRRLPRRARRQDRRPQDQRLPASSADRDKDGILDNEDACPDAPGPKNADPKKNGCPEARIEAGEIKILQQVKFKTGSADILPVSDAILNAVSDDLATSTPRSRRCASKGTPTTAAAAAMNKGLSATPRRFGRQVARQARHRQGAPHRARASA